MPDSTYHTTHAERNLDFLKSFIEEDKYYDWKITVSFYTVLHVIENAIYSTQNFNIQGKKIAFKGSEQAKQLLINNGIIKLTEIVNHHKVRKIIVDYGFPEVDAHYAGLSNMAWSARYVQFAWEQKDVFIAVEIYLKEILKWSNTKFSTKFDIAFGQKKEKKN